MFYQITPLPRNVVKENTPVEDIAILKLAPFTPCPKILFEDVIVGQQITKKLLIQNPNPSANKLTITKVPPPDRNVICSWKETVIDGCSDLVLELTWIPKEEGGWRDTLSIVDNRHVKRDIPIIFKSIQKKGKKGCENQRNKKLRPTVVALPAAKKYRSPKNIKKKRSPLKTTENLTANISTCKLKTTPKNKNARHIESDKENSQIHYKNSQNFSYNLMENSSFFLSPTHVSLNCGNISQTPIRRETYAVTKEIPVMVDSPDNFNDSLDLPCDPTIIIDRSHRDEKSDYLIQKLLSDSFAFSNTTNTATKKDPIFRFTLNDSEVMNNTSDTFNCSVKQKVMKANSNLFAFKPDSTYEMSPGMKNLSGDTKDVSGETYTILSPENKDKFQSVVDNEKFTNIITSSPILANTQANSNYLLNFSGNNAKSALFCIEEERTFNISSPGNFNNSNIGIKRKSELSELVFTVSPPKRAFIQSKLQSNKKSNVSWSKKLNKTGITPQLKLNLSICPTKPKHSNANTSAVTTTQNACQIDPFLIAAMYDTANVNFNFDPFISSTLYYDEISLEKQTKELKKWLNAMLTPPTELQTSTESKKVDVGKLWRECVKKDLIYAPTKEKVCAEYHTNHKLDVLRRTAKNMFYSLEMRNVLSKVAIIIENKQLCIREDKNLHLDVGLQSNIMTLLLCYNPLWLRIGLETIYNETIQLESNSDVIGLSSFILLRFFRCPDLLTKNKHISHTKYLPTYSIGIKKFTLKKFLMLVYFLDQAKTKKLIPHDPCLFCRDAPLKESKELLISFARELLSAVGDVTRFLKRLGYEVTHKQNYIDEFDYAVKDLGVDLRDGIRLTRVMEIILLRNDLTNQLRGPAISRLQKIHNCKLAIDSLFQAGFSIAGDITAKDIVDGHREKTLSLLWQIIYKFQTPRFTKAATKIQLWWKSLKIVIRRRILDRPRRIKENAAVKIQQYYRSWKLKTKERSKFLTIKASVILIQKYVRFMFLMKRDRLQYLLKRQAAIMIQQKYRSLKLMKEQQNYYLRLKKAAILIQRRFRNKILTKQTRNDYLKLKEIVIKMQRNFRSKKITRVEQNNFIQLRNAVICIQRHFKARCLMERERNNYLRIRFILIRLQQKFKANLLMKKIRNDYLQQRKRIIYIQQKYRAKIQMKKDLRDYLLYKKSVILVQNRFRANFVMKQTRNNYLNLKEIVIKIQRLFRSKKITRVEQNHFVQLRNAAICIQRHFKAKCLMERERNNYLRIRFVVIRLQQKFKANLLMKKIRNDYLQQRKHIIYIQQKYRAKIQMKKDLKDYLLYKKSVILIQNRFRANCAMKQVRQKYLDNKRAAIVIQTKFRAYLEMKNCRENYLVLKCYVVCMQRKFRANIAMKKIRNNYIKLKKAAILIQQQFRARKAMLESREKFIKLKKLVIMLQQRFRANVMAKKYRETYLLQKKYVVLIQQKFRAILDMRKERQNYLRTKKAVVILQQHFRANIAMKNDREYYLQLRKAVLFLQKRFRSNVAMKQIRFDYLEKKRCAIIMQQRFRANLVARHHKKMYLQQKCSAVLIQNWFRNVLTTKQQRDYYLLLRKSVCILQQKFKNYLVMKKQRQLFIKIKQSAVIIQTYYRSYLLMKKYRNLYLQTLTAIKIIQINVRNYLTMKKCRSNFLRKREAAIKIQRYFRNYQKKCFTYKINVQAVIKIQSWVRMHAAKKQLVLLRKEAKENEEKSRLKRLSNAATKIQAVWRGYKTRRKAGKQITLIRYRSVDAANNAIPELTIAQRNREAIDSLMYQTNMKTIIRALTLLDFTTRLFPNLCVDLCEQITDRLYILLVATNRSAPDMDACVLCVSILINLYKYRPTSAAVWKTKYTERLLALLLNWSDKDGPLFPYVCTLIWLFSQNPEYCQVIKNEENVEKILIKTYQHCERKQKMLSKMRNASAVKVSKEKHVRPSLVPDWGIINEKYPRTFKNSLFAIKCVLKRLDINPC